MKILYLPLDERPCNRKYPAMIAALDSEIELRVPDLAQLGQKKSAADVDQLWDWIESVSGECQFAILSVEMLVYGGLLPSRLHHTGVETLIQRLGRLRQLKQHHPQLQIFASNLIMRTPHYNSSEEEPDYYADYGEAIFRWGWLSDRQQRQGLTEDETQELQHLTVQIPSAHLQDYRDRRQTNLAINQATLDLAHDGVIDFLSIPQDDSAPFGFTAIDQRQVIQKIIDLRLQQKVHLYPGADEVGCTLLARAYHQLRSRPCKLYPLWSSVGGEQIIPLYEDRPLGESLKAHILAAGAQWVSTPEEADVILAINAPGQVMQESWDQTHKDVTYSSYRNLRFFVDQIQQQIQRGKAVAIADVAFANGGETELVQMLDDTRLWDSLLAYGGWNTNCNTLGTVIATAALGHRSSDDLAIAFNKIYHLLEDWGYQGVIRMEMVHHFLPTLGASYYDFKAQDSQIHAEMQHRLMQLWQSTLKQSFINWRIQQLNPSSPWNRMFEVDLELKLEPN